MNIKHLGLALEVVSVFVTMRGAILHEDTRPYVEKFLENLIKAAAQLGGLKEPVHVEIDLEFLFEQVDGFLNRLASEPARLWKRYLFHSVETPSSVTIPSILLDITPEDARVAFQDQVDQAYRNLGSRKIALLITFWESRDMFIASVWTKITQIFNNSSESA